MPWRVVVEKPMSKSRHREVSCAIILDTLGRFLLQLRDNVPGILQPGKIGLFGGHREDGELICNAWSEKYMRRSAILYHRIVFNT